VGGVEFFIRRMSNDDRPDEFYDFMADAETFRRPELIAAFCPKFEDPRAGQCLHNLRRKGYRLFFWVLRRAYRDVRIITPSEIGTLEEAGRVAVYDARNAEDHERARALRLFIEGVVLA
jgi:hypothetical protein